MSDLICKYCEKILNEEKGETAHGCLDCHMSPWQETIEYQERKIKEMQEVINKLGKMGEFTKELVNYVSGISSEGFWGKLNTNEGLVKILDEHKNDADELMKSKRWNLARETMLDEQVKQYYKGE